MSKNVGERANSSRQRRLTIKIQKIIAYFCAHSCSSAAKPKSKRKQGENEQQTELSCKWKTMPKCNKINKRQQGGGRGNKKQKNLHYMWMSFAGFLFPYTDMCVCLFLHDIRFPFGFATKSRISSCEKSTCCCCCWC